MNMPFMLVTLETSQLEIVSLNSSMFSSKPAMPVILDTHTSHQYHRRLPKVTRCGWRHRALDCFQSRIRKDKWDQVAVVQEEQLGVVRE